MRIVQTNAGYVAERVPLFVEGRAALADVTAELISASRLLPDRRCRDRSCPLRDSNTFAIACAKEPPADVARAYSIPIEAVHQLVQHAS